MLRRAALVRTVVSEEILFLQEPHGVTSQKTSFFIVTAVKNSNHAGERVFARSCLNAEEKRKIVASARNPTPIPLPPTHIPSL
jgi:hypothetical protein